MANALVLTPGGYRPQSAVHLIEKGHVLDGAGGRVRKLDRGGTVIKDFGEIKARVGGPLMPGNVLRLREALMSHSGPTSGHAQPDLIGLAERAPGFGSGWIVFASWTNNTGHPLSLFTTTWAVPSPPLTQSSQTIFLFNGIQNSTMIYQPVLQWGQSAAGGGNYWSVASWYADGQLGQAFHSSLVPVSTGDVLVGVMALTGESAQQFSYSCQFQNIADTELPIQNVDELTWAVETLEVYGIAAASDYPATSQTSMTAIEIKTSAGDAALAWQATNAVTDVGQRAVVISDASPGGEVDLYFSPLLWHTVRGPLGWQPHFDLIPGQGQNKPGVFAAISCAGVGEVTGGLLGDNNQLIVVAIVDGQLWTNSLGANDMWLPSFGIIPGQGQNQPGAFTSISCGGVDSQLYVVGIVGGQLWTNSLGANGVWLPSFGLVPGQGQNQPGAFTAISCVGVNNQLYVVGIAGGQLWSNSQNALGAWQPSFDLIPGQGQNQPGAFTAISCASVGADHQLNVVGIAGGQLWITSQNAIGAWQPSFDLISSQGQNTPGAFTAISCAGVGNQLQVIGIV